MPAINIQNYTKPNRSSANPSRSRYETDHYPISNGETIVCPNCGSALCATNALNFTRPVRQIKTITYYGTEYWSGSIDEPDDLTEYTISATVGDHFDTGWVDEECIEEDEDPSDEMDTCECASCGTKIIYDDWNWD